MSFQERFKGKVTTMGKDGINGMVAQSQQPISKTADAQPFNPPAYIPEDYGSVPQKPPISSNRYEGSNKRSPGVSFSKIAANNLQNDSASANKQIASGSHISNKKSPQQQNVHPAENIPPYLIVNPYNNKLADSPAKYNEQINQFQYPIPQMPYAYPYPPIPMQMMPPNNGNYSQPVFHGFYPPQMIYPPQFGAFPMISNDIANRPSLSGPGPSPNFKTSNEFKESIPNSTGNNYPKRASSYNQKVHEGYKPYTLKEYKDKHKNTNFKYGGLGPNTNTEEWKNRKEKMAKVQVFSDVIKEVNQQKLATTPSISAKQNKEIVIPNTRDRALEFAKNIPKPKPIKRREEDNKEDEEIGKIENELDVLAQKHAYFANKINQYNQICLIKNFLIKLNKDFLFSRNQSINSWRQQHMILKQI